MQIKIQFDCDNAAFEDTYEISAVLDRCKAKIERMIFNGEALEGESATATLRDTNGNSVGTVTIES
jgi:hypothetical protein